MSDDVITVHSTWSNKVYPHIQVRVLDLVKMKLGPDCWVPGVAYASVIMGFVGRTTFVLSVRDFRAEFCLMDATPTAP